MKNKIVIAIMTVFMLFNMCEALVFAENININFTNLEERPYAPNSLKEVEVMADGSVTGVDLYVDQELFQTIASEPYVFDLSSLSVGPHSIYATANSDSGDAKSETKNILVFGQNEYADANWAGSWNIDGTATGMGKHSGLDGYVSPKSDGTYVFPFNGGANDNYANRVAIESHSFDDSHGTVARLRKANVASNLTHKFIIQPPTGSTGSLFRSKLDVRIDELAGGDMGFSLKGAEAVCFGADSNGFFAVDEYNDRHYVDYIPGKWYTLELDVNALMGFYTARLIDCETQETSVIVENVYVGKFTPKLTFWFNLSSSVSLDVSIDNWIADKGYAVPTLSSVLIDKSADNHVIKAQINTNYSATADKPGINSINKDNVKVYCDSDEVMVKDVVYDAANHTGAIITLEEDIRSQSKYSVVLTTDVQNGRGTKIPAKQELFFLTEANSLDVTDVSLLTDEDGSSVTGTMIDTEGSGGTKFSIVSVWQSGKLIEIIVNEINWEDGCVFETDKVSLSEGQELEFAIWDGFALPIVITKLKF